jgi:hypothetical protein
MGDPFIDKKRILYYGTDPFSASAKGLGVKIGGVLRGVLPRSLGRLRRLRPAGFGWGRARRCGTRQPAASPTPPPIRARSTPSLTRVVQIRRDGGFPTPLVRPRLPRPFFSLISALWASTGPPRLHFIQKMASKGAARPPATHPNPFRYAKISGSLAFGGLPARRGLMIAPGTVTNALSASGLGSRPMGAPRLRSLNPRTFL